MFLHSGNNWNSDAAGTFSVSMSIYTGFNHLAGDTGTWVATQVRRLKTGCPWRAPQRERLCLKGSPLSLEGHGTCLRLVNLRGSPSFGGKEVPPLWEKAAAPALPVLSCFCSRTKGHRAALPMHSKTRLPACDLFRAERDATFPGRKRALRGKVLMNEMSSGLALTCKT